MARLPRLTAPGFPHHVILRGNNRQPIFLSSGDRQLFLDELLESSVKFTIAIHAYVLMDNHVHLLVTPQTHEGLPAMMQAIGRRYVRLFNDSHGRTGTLWEGRYRSTVVQTERYLLACMVYIDLNPVRAGMVGEAREFPWSSHAHYIGLTIDKLVTPHAMYWELGNTPFAREMAYADLVRVGLTRDQQSALTSATLKGWALGDSDFSVGLQKQTTRRVSKLGGGRPFLKKNSFPE